MLLRGFIQLVSGKAETDAELWLAARPHPSLDHQVEVVEPFFEALADVLAA